MKKEEGGQLMQEERPILAFWDTVLLTIPLLMTSFVAVGSLGEHVNCDVIGRCYPYTVENGSYLAVLINIILILIIGYFAGIFDS